MSQKAIIVGVQLDDNDLFEYEIDELKNLCLACEIDSVSTLIQSATTIHPKTYIRKGKIEELKLAIDAAEADIIVCNDELSPAQISTLEKLLDISVFDRTYIILEIFKRRAKTKEAILQVDIASLRYLMPRLIGLHQGFSRQRGVGGKGRGRGQGETQLELDRRNIGDRIAFLKKQLDDLKKDRAVQRQKRKNSDIPIVSLVGYTNSGKSSTLNALLDHSHHLKKEVLEKDMLFATLETSSRFIQLSNNHRFIAIDTVGFVSKLPHQLIEAFKSTLEEISESNLIIHVVDSSNEYYEDQIRITNEVLEELGVKDIPVIYAFNKMDKLDQVLFIPPTYQNSVPISATRGNNIEDLLLLIEMQLFGQEEDVMLCIPYDKTQVLDAIKAHAHIIEMDYNEKAVIIHAKMSKEKAKQYESFIQTKKPEV